MHEQSDIDTRLPWVDGEQVQESRRAARREQQQRPRLWWQSAYQCLWPSSHHMRTHFDAYTNTHTYILASVLLITHHWSCSNQVLRESLGDLSGLKRVWNNLRLSSTCVKKSIASETWQRKHESLYHSITTWVASLGGIFDVWVLLWLDSSIQVYPTDSGSTAAGENSNNQKNKKQKTGWQGSGPNRT